MNKEHKIFSFNILIFFGIFITISLGGKYIIASGILAILSAVIMYSYFQECEARKKIEKEEYELKKDKEKKLLIEVLNKINTSIDKNTEKNIEALEKIKNENYEEINEVIKMINEIKESNIENKNQVIYENINNTDRIVKNLINESKKMSIIIKDKAVKQEEVVKNASEAIYNLIKEDNKKLLGNITETKEQIINNNIALNIETKENYNNKILKIMGVIDKNTHKNIEIIDQLKNSENNLMDNNLKLNKNITLLLAENDRNNEESFVKLVEKINEFNKSVLTTQKEESNKLNDTIVQSTEKIKNEIEKCEEDRIKREKQKELRSSAICEEFKEVLNKEINEVRDSLEKVNTQIQVGNGEVTKQLLEVNSNLEINKESVNEANIKTLDKIESFKELNIEVTKKESDKLNGLLVKLTEEFKEKVNEHKEDEIEREKIREFKKVERDEEFKSSLKEINEQIQVNSNKAINQLVAVNNNLEVNKESVNEANIKMLNKIESFKELNIEVTKKESDKLNGLLVKLTEEIKEKVNEHKEDEIEREKVREFKKVERDEEFKSSLKEINEQIQVNNNKAINQLVAINNNLEINKESANEANIKTLDKIESFKNLNIEVVKEEVDKLNGVLINLTEDIKEKVNEHKEAEIEREKVRELKILGRYEEFKSISNKEVNKLKNSLEEIKGQAQRSGSLIEKQLVKVNLNLEKNKDTMINLTEENKSEVLEIKKILNNNIEQIKNNNFEIKETLNLNVKSVEKLIVELTLLKEKINLKDLEIEVKNINKYIEEAFKQQKNIVKNSEKYSINKVDEVAVTNAEKEYSKQEELGVGHYKDGKLIRFEYDDGRTVEFKYKNGIIDSSLTKVRGKIESKTTFKKGKIYRDVHYKNNKVEVDYLYYESGEIEKETIYKNGTIEVRTYDEKTGKRIK